MKCHDIVYTCGLRARRKGHEVKCLLAWLAHTRAMVSHQWLSDRLHMGNATTVSTYIKRVKEAESGPLARSRDRLVATVV